MMSLFGGHILNIYSFHFLQYCMNAALERTSVASTTILFSTSGLFTLLISALLGEDSINLVNLVSVFVSMAGVAMTIYGKTWEKESQSTTSLYVSSFLSTSFANRLDNMLIFTINSVFLLVLGLKLIKIGKQKLFKSLKFTSNINYYGRNNFYNYSYDLFLLK